MFATSVLATAALFPFLLHTEAAEFPSEMVASQNVTIHSGATTSYKLVDSLTPGEKAIVIAEFENVSGEKWYNLDLGHVKGWGLATSFQSDAVVAPPSTATEQPVEENLTDEQRVEIQSVDEQPVEEQSNKVGIYRSAICNRSTCSRAKKGSKFW